MEITGEYWKSNMSKACGPNAKFFLVLKLEVQRVTTDI